MKALATLSFRGSDSLELENPFGTDDNKLPLAHFQAGSYVTPSTQYRAKLKTMEA